MKSLLTIIVLITIVGFVPNNAIALDASCSVKYSPGQEWDACNGITKKQDRIVTEKNRDKIHNRLSKCLKSNEHLGVGVTGAVLAYMDGLEPQEALKCGLLISTAYENYSDPKAWLNSLSSLKYFAVARGKYLKCTTSNDGKYAHLCNPSGFKKVIDKAIKDSTPFIVECKEMIKVTEIPNLTTC